MARLERITITNDARVPRVAAFPNGVTWYVYIRDLDGGLYLQREFGGVRAAEVLIVKPVNRVEVIHDPDAGKAYLYFVNDECLLRIEVTDALETPTVQAYTRSATWYDAAFGGFGAGVEMVHNAPQLDPPSIALLPGLTPSTRTLVIVAPDVSLTRNRLLVGFRLYRDENLEGQGFVFYGIVPYTGAPYLTVQVPISVTPLTRWYATSYRMRFGFLESVPSNIEQDMEPFRADVMAGGFGAGVDQAWSQVDKTPIKKSYGPDTMAGGFGAGVDQAWSQVDKTPIKKSYGPDTMAGGFGAGVDVSWAVNGTEIINP